MAVEPKKSRTDKAVPSRVDGQSLQAISGFVLDEDGAFQKLLNDRVRLGILSSLAVAPSLSFKDLRKLLGVTDGNLSTHARKLENAGFVDCNKSFAQRLPKTEYVITSAGRAALQRYLKHMEAIISATGKVEDR